MAVAGATHDPPTATSSSVFDQLVEDVERLAPPTITSADNCSSRVDHVGEQEGRQFTVSRSGGIGDEGNHLFNDAASPVEA